MMKAKMIVYSKSEAEKHLAAVLEAARRDGDVRIRDENGQEFVVRRRSAADRSPLDVPGVDLGLTADEILEAVRESRER